ncbi:hypothetical protein [Aeromicrobium sp. UC242_57]|uniref:hypothetical protein n=1 Tax=Aeromicrobium sp. UC242_57 TaxID=3374624 RepID=UPI0037B9BBB2
MLGAEEWGEHPTSAETLSSSMLVNREVGHTLVMVPESSLRKMHPELIGRIARLAAVSLVVCGLGVQSGSAAEDPDFPGLPAFDQPGAWVGPRATGINYVDRAKQWVRVPPLVVGAFNRVVKVRTFSCSSPSLFSEIGDYHATAYFKSSRGSSRPWGQIGPFTARTVAFGSIPVEAAVVIRQLRDSEDLPVGLEIKQVQSSYCAGKSPFPDHPQMGTLNGHWDPATVNGQVEVVIAKLTVDGVNLSLAGQCRTREPGTIALAGREYFTANPDNFLPGIEPNPQNLMTTPHFGVANGGVLNGTVDIPNFAGCTTKSGEDVSRLVTAAVSGSGNRVTMRSEGLVAAICMRPDAPTGPGQQCEPMPGLPFPGTE